MNIFQSIYVTLFRTYRRKDIAKWGNSVPADHKSIFGVYHVMCAPGWQGLVKEQTDRLRVSGLAAQTKKLYVSCITKAPTDEVELRQILQGINYEIFCFSSEDTIFEYPALDKVSELAKQNDCLVYYFHTKGISYHNPNHVKNRRFLRLKRNETAWRKAMEYYIMDNWRAAVNILNAGYDTYGSLRYPPRPADYTHYAGNFWWGTSAYLSRLIPVAKEKRSNRLFAELWIFTERPKDYSSFDTLAMLYQVYLPESLYKQKYPTLTDVVPYILKFNWTKFKKKVLHDNWVEKDIAPFRLVRDRD